MKIIQPIRFNAPAQPQTAERNDPGRHPALIAAEARARRMALAESAPAGVRGSHS